MDSTVLSGNREMTMNTRDDIINQIENALDSDGSPELAEAVFDILRADDRIYYDSLSQGLILRHDVDVFEVAAQVSAASHQ